MTIELGRDSFDKRFYTPRGFLRDLASLVSHLPDVAAAITRGRVSRAFAEKIMLAVTQVNGCRYCSYVHTRLAQRQGISKEELRSLAVADPVDTSGLLDSEMLAITFARHFAETGGHPNPPAMHNLRSYYGPMVSRDILAYIRLITIGNLAGNSVDAFLNRLAGRPASGSNPLSEAVLFLVFAPFTLPLLWLMRRSARTTANTT